MNDVTLRRACPGLPVAVAVEMVHSVHVKILLQRLSCNRRTHHPRLYNIHSIYPAAGGSIRRRKKTRNQKRRAIIDGSEERREIEISLILADAPER
jgi:hypothetical protein